MFNFVEISFVLHNYIKRYTLILQRNKMNFGISVLFGIFVSILVSTDGKSINIQIDSDDIMKIISGMMGTDTLKKFTEQVVDRSAARFRGYENPYHPEDRLAEDRAIGLDQALRKGHLKLQASKLWETELKDVKEPIDFENDKFQVNALNKISDDELTENDGPKKKEVKNRKAAVMNLRRKEAGKVDVASSRRDPTSPTLMMRKDIASIVNDDRSFSLLDG